MNTLDNRAWALVSLITGPAGAAAVDQAKLDELTRAVEPRVIEWRRDIHEHPELSNREVRTAKLVADHLKRLGLEVRTGIAHTGVTGFLQGRFAGADDCIARRHGRVARHGKSPTFPSNPSRRRRIAARPSA